MGYVPFSTKSVPSVGCGTVLTLIQVPKVAARVDVFTFVRGHELVVVPSPHTASDDLTNTWHQDINRLSNALVILSSLHIKCLDFDWEVGKEDRAVDFVGHLSLGSFGTISIKSEYGPLGVR